MHVETFCQTLPVGLLENTDDSFRRQQLLGNDTSKSSFLIRPINIANRNNLVLDASSNINLANFSKKIFSTNNNAYAVYLLPITVQQQFNSHHPYGSNDGSMIPSRGYQAQIAAGLYAKAGPLSIQLRPEYVYAQNKAFRELQDVPNIPYFNTNLYLSNYYNKIDLPERFGEQAYAKMNWGQSSIRLTFDPVSIGLSNENLWWGPGVRSSLLMSNNAPGFKHLTLNTSRPVNTPVGSFEAQVIAGRLEQSGVTVINNPLVTAKPDDWRLITGIAFTYQPKWVPNLYLGFDQTTTVYNADRGEDVPNGKGKYASFFARWVMPESRAEIYAQLGSDRHPYESATKSVNKSATAYVVGFRKLLALKAVDEYIQVGIEMSSLESARSGLVLEQPSWYVHSRVRAGYTNRGEILGAGIGTGSSQQSLEVSWVKGLKKIGLQLERVVHNNDLFYEAVREIRLNWVDLAMGGKFDWTYKNLIFSNQVSYVHSLNYQYEFKPSATKAYWQWDKQDVNNLHVKLGIMYRF